VRTGLTRRHLEDRAVRRVMRCNPTTINYEGQLPCGHAMCRDEVGSCIVLGPTKSPYWHSHRGGYQLQGRGQGYQAWAVIAHDIMSTPLITISADRSVEDAAHMMIKHRVRRLPVVDDVNRVIGIVTVRDILTVSTEINDLMADLVEINRLEEVEVGVCSRCGQMSDDLRRIDNNLLCPSCREEELLQ